MRIQEASHDVSDSPSGWTSLVAPFAAEENSLARGKLAWDEDRAARKSSATAVVIIVERQDI